MSVLFSIIIPTFNRGYLLENAIQSVLKQTYPHFEIIVVDDGSTDNTKELIQTIIAANSTKQISYWHKNNAERGAARNFGLIKAKGDYVIFFDSDDTFYSNHLEVAAKFIGTKPGVEIFHMRYDIKDNANKIISEGPVYESPPNKELITGNFLSCNGVVVRKEIALENKFNEDRDLSAAEDWELWLRLSVKYPIHYINTITSTIYNHNDRSVFEVNKAGLIKRMELLLKYVGENDSIMNAYPNSKQKLQASCYSYVSLHLALTKKYRTISLRYLLKTLSIKPTFIFEKRFFGILKHLI